MINNVQTTHSVDYRDVLNVIDQSDLIFNSQYMSAIYHDGFYFYLIMSHKILSITFKYISENQHSNKQLLKQNVVSILYKVLVKIFNSTMFSNHMHGLIQDILNQNTLMKTLAISNIEKNILKNIVTNKQYIPKLDFREYTGNRGIMANLYIVKNWSILPKEYKNIKIFAHLFYDLNDFIYTFRDLNQDLKKKYQSIIVLDALKKDIPNILEIKKLLSLNNSGNNFLHFSLLIQWISVYKALDKPNLTNSHKDLLILSRVHKLYQDFYLFKKQIISIATNIKKYVDMHSNKSYIVVIKCYNNIVKITNNMLSVYMIDKIPTNQGTGQYIYKLKKNNIKKVDGARFIIPIRNKTVDIRMQMRRNTLDLKNIY